MESLTNSQRYSASTSTLHDSYKDDLEAHEKLLDSASIQSDDVDQNSTDGLLRGSWREGRRPGRIATRMWCLTIINLMTLCITILLSISKLLPWFQQDMNACVKETSYYSPILDAKKIEFTDVHFNGTLWPSEDQAWSRKAPDDKEAEQLWDDWEPVDTFPITREQVIALGKDPETVAKYPDEYWGMGDDAYIASLDVLHKIHCLNELRKMTFTDYGITAETKRVKQHGQLWWIHLRHCVDMLTQDMICHADADLVTYNWRDTQSYPFPDFGINRKCRNIDTLLEYRDEHKVSMAKYIDMTKPKHGINQTPYEPGYYAMFGFDGSDLFPDGKDYPYKLPDTDQWFGRKPNLTYLNSDEFKAKQYKQAHTLLHTHHD